MLGLFELAIWSGDTELQYPPKNAANFARDVRDKVRFDRVTASIAVINNHLTKARTLFHQTLPNAREINLVNEEILSLIGLATIAEKKKQFFEARDLLADIWELAERGPYPLFHADAFNVLAQIERDEWNTAAAIEAATKAYRLAWCDGPPFAYHWGLEKAKQHLKELGAPEPEMPPFDESKFEPMPKVEINPHDEFYVDEESIDSN